MGAELVLQPAERRYPLPRCLEDVCSRPRARRRCETPARRRCPPEGLHGSHREIAERHLGAELHQIHEGLLGLLVGTEAGANLGPPV